MVVIGRKDHIDLPGLGLVNIGAKIDTGAYGCALHCHYIRVLEKEGRKVLAFKVLDPTHAEYEDRIIEFENFSDKVVKSSTGDMEHRYTIRTGLSIFNKEYRVEFSLTNRKSMKFPVLIGRKFLTKRFLVDVRQKDLSFSQKIEKK